MKKSLLLISVLAFALAISCKKEKEPTPYDAKYTSETPAQSKAKVEDNAIALVDQLDAMTSATAIEVLMNLNDIESGTILKSTASQKVLTPVSLMSTLNKSENVSAVFKGMQAFEEMIASDPLSFKTLFDSAAGKYTYNFQTLEFKKTKLDKAVVIEFPGKHTDQTNTAVITINSFAVKEITDTTDGWIEGLDTELPTSLKIDLKYNTKSIAGASFAASYMNTGIPTKVSVELYLDDFTFTTTALHSPFSSASWRNTLKFKSDILMETYIAAKGNWTEENRNKSIDEIITNANAHVILMNLKVAGMVNLKAIGEEMTALSEGPVLPADQQRQAVVDVINKNAQLVVIYRDSNTKIAEAEAYVAYDDIDHRYYPSMRFVYADGSKVDVETYVKSELDGFYASVNDFIDQLNVEYDLNLSPIAFPAK